MFESTYIRLTGLRKCWWEAKNLVGGRGLRLENKGPGLENWGFQGPGLENRGPGLENRRFQGPGFENQGPGLENQGLEIGKSSEVGGFSPPLSV